MTTAIQAPAPVPVPVSPVSLAGNGRRIKSRFRFGAWLVDPSSNSIANPDETRQMEPRTMDVLVALCRANGAIVGPEELLEQCWGSTLHGDNPVHKNLALLRRLLGDDASAPRFIETIRKRGYRTVAEIDFTIDEPRRAALWDRGSPFRGLLPFDDAHADVFYGRDDATRKLAVAAQDQIDNGLAMLLLLGPSGSGKTSLVQAGLFPAMSRPCVANGPVLLATTTFDIADQGGQTLFVALASAMLDLQWRDGWAFENESAAALGEQLEHACEGVGAQLRSMLARHGGGRRFAIFIDRFEALFNVNRVTEAERDAFLKTMEQLARSDSCLLVVACRNDFYPSVARYPVLMQGKPLGAHVDLAPPAFSDIAQMIRKPAAAARLTFGTDPVTRAGLDDILCESAARSPDALPLLQYCLHELYRLRTPEGELNFAAFHDLGDLEGAIGRRSEQVVMMLDDAQRAALPHIMSLVTVLSIDEDQVTSQRAPWSALRSEPARQAVAALIEARLFVSDLVGGLPVFGIAHEAILRRWPRMSEWIAAHRDVLRARGRLTQQAARWNADGRPADLLLPRGKLLDEARDLQRTDLWLLDPAETDLIRMSNRRARQFEWVRVTGLGLIIVLAILSSALALNAYHAQRAAEVRRAEVEGLVDFMLGDFADRLRPLGRLNLLESVSAKALEYLQGSHENELSPAGLTLRAKALQVIGEVSRSRGDTAQALDALGKANAILMRLHEATPQDVEIVNNLGINAYWVGQLHKDHNNMPAADAAWRNYLLFADRLQQLEPDKVEWWIEQSYAHNNLGSLAIVRGMPALAATEFAASIALKQRALERTPDAKLLIAELADSYSWLASARQSLGDLGGADRLYAQAIGLIQRLRERFPDEPMWINRLVRTLQQRAGLALALGQDDKALADLKVAREQSSRIVRQDPDNHRWQVELANIELDLLNVMARREPAGRLLPQLRSVHAKLAATLRLNPQNAGWARSEAVARSRVAAALLSTGDAGAARREIDIAATRLRKLHDANPGSVPLRLALTNALLVYAGIQHAVNDTAAATSSCRQAIQMIRVDMATMDFQILDPWGQAMLCLHETGTVNIPWTRLQQIGYRDSTYRKTISNR
jgi:DNA-binding winged helix-turn-helix (wHTH) protein/tetratricopeptide (TPR) repeat protein